MVELLGQATRWFSQAANLFLDTHIQPHPLAFSVVVRKESHGTTSRLKDLGQDTFLL